MPFFPPPLPFRRGEAGRCRGVRQGAGRDADVGGSQTARPLTLPRPGKAGRGRARPGGGRASASPGILGPDRGRPAGRWRGLRQGAGQYADVGGRQDARPPAWARPGEAGRGRARPGEAGRRALYAFFFES